MSFVIAPPQGILGLFFPAAADTAIGDYQGLACGSNQTRRMTFRVPDGFNSLISLAAVVIPTATAGSLNIDRSSDYALDGEDAQANTEAETSALFAFTVNQIQLIDLTPVFSSLVANHNCGIAMIHNSIGQTVYYLGVKMEYQ